MGLLIAALPVYTLLIWALLIGALLVRTLLIVGVLPAVLGPLSLAICSLGCLRLLSAALTINILPLSAALSIIRVLFLTANTLGVRACSTVLTVGAGTIVLVVRTGTAVLFVRVLIIIIHINSYLPTSLGVLIRFLYLILPNS